MLSGNRFHQLAGRLQIERQRRRNSRILEPRRQEFRDFYQKLPDKRNIFYMFFTGGLLHWVAKSTSYVPDDANLVLFGSALPKDEQEWVRDTLGRPFYHLDLRINDKLAWTFLFDTNERNFGWLDIDCFVLNAGLFDEMATISADDCVNGAWWYDTGFGFQLSATYFQFFNVPVLRALRTAGVAASPNCYSYHPIGCPAPGQRFYSEALTRRLRRQLLKVVPADEAGLPRPPGTDTYFDTTVMPQLMARSLGFGAHQVRGLRRRAWNMRDLEEISDELIHIGAVSYGSVLSEYYQPIHSPDIALRYLLADYIALSGAERLPASYADRRELIVAELARSGLTPAAAQEAAYRHLIDDRGLSAHAAGLVVTGVHGQYT
jgi:hypothetical protein